MKEIQISAEKIWRPRTWTGKIIHIAIEYTDMSRWEHEYQQITIVGFEYETVKALNKINEAT